MEEEKRNVIVAFYATEAVLRLVHVVFYTYLYVHALAGLAATRVFLSAKRELVNLNNVTEVFLGVAIAFAAAQGLDLCGCTVRAPPVLRHAC